MEFTNIESTCVQNCVWGIIIPFIFVAHSDLCLILLYQLVVYIVSLLNVYILQVNFC